MTILSGWKEIAAYLHQGVRTIQRWEKIPALPIHRLRTGKGGTVIAFAEELDAWEHAKPVRLPDEIAAIKIQIAELESEVRRLKHELSRLKTVPRRGVEA